ncbi:MAG: FecR family protein [Pirellula sp.]|nr:FecR family protein [Pirellula sp.]
MSDSENKLNDASQPGSNPWGLWDRYVAGDELSDKQSEMLRNALRSDTLFRQNAIGEQTVDQLLRIESETPDQSEAFVSRVLAQCNSSNLLDRELLENINKERLSKRSGNSTLYRHSITWFAMAATVLVSLTATGFWFRRHYEVNESENSTDLVAGTKEIEPIQESPALGASQANVLEGLVDKSRSATEQTEDTNTTNSKLGGLQNTNAPDQNSDVFASIVDSKEVGGDSPLLKGFTIGREVIEIDQGEIMLAMSCGARVEVFAPSRFELISGDSLRLVSGELSVSMPNEAAQFQLKTPTVAITNSGSVFDVVVEKSGRTEVEVRRGGIVVEALEYPSAQAWNLNAEAFNLLTIYTPGTSSEGVMQPSDDRQGSGDTHSPIASLARTLAGEAKGVITFNGQSRSFDDEIVFAKVREQVFRRAKTSTDQFAKTWSQFVETATNQPQPEGRIQLNGKEYSFGNYNEAVLAQNDVLAQFAPIDTSKDSNTESNEETESTVSNSAIPSGFQGTLFIRGQRRDFRTFEEYQSAMRELMGPAAEFGFFPFGK